MIKKIYRMLKLGKCIMLSFINIYNKSQLDAQIIISFTSYGARINRSIPTVVSLITQKHKAEVIMFVADHERKKIGILLKSIEKISSKFHIILCHDIKSYKKIIPLIDFSFLVNSRDVELISSKTKNLRYVLTADDDVYYHPSTLTRMIELTSNLNDAVVFNEGMVVKLNMPYSEWSSYNFDIDSEIMPIGAGGILYDFELLKKNYQDNFMDLAPTSDDIWLFSRLRDSANYVYCRNNEFITISKLLCQKENLFSVNKKGGNDAAIARLLK